MPASSRITALVGALALALLLSGPLAAAEPELVNAKPFNVQIANGQVNVTFTLALSDISSYPVSITAICCSTEELLYQGTLSEGSYKFSAPLKKISGRGDLKVILKTRVTNRSEQGNTTNTVYLKWQGAM